MLPTLQVPTNFRTRQPPTVLKPQNHFYLPIFGILAYIVAQEIDFLKYAFLHLVFLKKSYLFKLLLIYVIATKTNPWSLVVVIFGCGLAYYPFPFVYYIASSKF